MQNGIRQLTSSDLADVTNAPVDDIGVIGMSEDGRRFRYTQFGGTFTAGNLLVAAALVSAHQNIAVQTAAKAGDTQVLVTLGAAAATQDQYAGGRLVVGVDNSGVPITRRIRGNTAGNSSATITVLLDTTEPLLFALTTSHVVSLSANEFKGPVASSTAGLPVGVAVNSGTIGQCGWMQTHGPVGLVNDAAGALTALGLLKQSTNVAGAVNAGGTAGDLTIGHVVQGAAASKSFLARVSIGA